MVFMDIEPINERLFCLRGVVTTLDELVRCFEEIIEETLFSLCKRGILFFLGHTFIIHTSWVEV